MGDPIEVLTSFAHQFAIATPPTPPATAPSFAITLLPPADSIPDLGLLLSVTSPPRVELRPAAVDLQWIMKEVRFASADLESVGVVGGMPVSDFIPPPGSLGVPSLTGATHGPTAPPGVPGLLGRIGGTVEVPVTVTDTLAPEEAGVVATVRWRVRDERGEIVPNLAWRLSSGATGTTGEILQPLGPLPLTPPADLLTVRFPVQFVELVGGVPGLPTRRIEAAIRLEVTGLGVATGWVDLPPITLTLPVIPVPAVAIFAEHVDFGGRLFILVPSRSPLAGVADVAAAVATLLGTLSAVPDAATLFRVLFAQFGPGGAVGSALASGARLFFVAADEVRTLYDYVWTDWFFVKETPADRISSMALLGHPDRGVACFNAPDFRTDEGELRLFADAGLMTTIRNLHSAAPPCDPAGNVSAPHAPAGGNIGHVINSFGDEMHSIRFV